MTTQKRLEQPLTKAELRAMKFMGARLEADAQRHKEFIETLDPRERERLAGNLGLE
jgi:hypothetical protein